jgi:hypothetical protein
LALRTILGDFPRFCASLYAVPWRGDRKRYSPRFIALVLRRANPLLGPMLVFSAYYLVPLVLCLAQDLRFAGLARFDIEFAPKSTSLYLADTVHLAFSVLVSFALIPFHNIVACMGKVVRHIRRRLGAEGAQWEKTYFRNRSLVLHPKWIVPTIIFAIATFAILYSRAHDPEFESWWGSSARGYAGLYFAFIASQMVFWGTIAFLTVGAYSLTISSLDRFNLAFEPFRPDDCCNLRPVGLIILNMWVFSLAMAVAVYIVFKQGYLELERNPAIWALAIFATILVPLIALIPIWRTATAIENARDRYVGALGARFVQKEQSGSGFGDRLEIVSRLNSYHTLPFRGRTLTLLAILNAIQVLSSFRELAGF